MNLHFVGAEYKLAKLFGGGIGCTRGFDSDEVVVFSGFPHGNADAKAKLKEFR